MVIKKKIKKKVVARVPRTRNGGTLTESGFWQMIRSALRNRTQYWIPRANCLKNARRISQSNNKRLKWEFQCSDCKHWFSQQNVEAHHSLEAGKLNSYEDLPSFVKNLFTEEDWICLCKDCHKKCHKKEHLSEVKTKTENNGNSIKRIKCKDKEET